MGIVSADLAQSIERSKVELKSGLDDHISKTNERLNSVEETQGIIFNEIEDISGYTSWMHDEMRNFIPDKDDRSMSKYNTFATIMNEMNLITGVIGSVELHLITAIISVFLLVSGVIAVGIEVAAMYNHASTFIVGTIAATYFVLLISLLWFKNTITKDAVQFINNHMTKIENCLIASYICDLSDKDTVDFVKNNYNKRQVGAIHIE